MCQRGGGRYLSGKIRTPLGSAKRALLGLHGLACAAGLPCWGIFASIAEFECELIRERVWSGLVARARTPDHEFFRSGADSAAVGAPAS